MGEPGNYLFAKLIIRKESKNLPFLRIGKRISSKLGVFKGDEIRIFSPLDAKLTTMKFPIKTMTISDVYSVPVLDFDNLYIISNDFIRYLSYPLWIWLVEILVGYPASQIGIRIWDYRYLSNNKHWKGIVSYVHFPVWIVFGILVELVDKFLS